MVWKLLEENEDDVCIRLIQRGNGKVATLKRAGEFWDDTNGMWHDGDEFDGQAIHQYGHTIWPPAAARQMLRRAAVDDGNRQMSEFVVQFELCGADEVPEHARLRPDNLVFGIWNWDRSFQEHNGELEPDAGRGSSVDLDASVLGLLEWS